MLLDDVVKFLKTSTEMPNNFFFEDTGPSDNLYGIFEDCVLRDDNDSDYESNSQYHKENEELLKSIKAVIVESVGGGEGDGETCYRVYKFSNDTEEVYIQFDGWYQSYHGSEYEEYFEVTPEVRLTTYYILKE